MKNVLMALLLSGLLLLNAGGCYAETTSQITGSSGATTETNTPSSNVTSLSGYNIDVSDEKPVQPSASSPIAPELIGNLKNDVTFLSTSQWGLLEKGYLLMQAFVLSTGEFAEDVFETSASSQKVVDGITYEKYSGSKYKGWNDFESDMLSIFTKEYFDQINSKKVENSTDAKVYIDVEGKLYFIAADRGANPTYMKSLDRYELVELNDKQIIFNLIAYYVSTDDVASGREIPVDMNRCSVVLKNTKNGWRIAKITLPY